LGLTENITFTGHISNLPEWLSKADIVIVPSKVEGFGLIILEAFNAKKFVMGFDVPAINE